MSEPLPSRAQVVIVGAGVNGLGLAYRLAKAGLTDVVVLERKYIPYGSSGRNGGGVRMQWGSSANADLARASIREWRTLASEVGFQTWFRESGYLFLAWDEAHIQRLRDLVAFQRSIGAPTRLVEPGEARVIAPGADLAGLVGGSFNPDDGILFPWSVVQGYLKRCRELGVRVATFTGVTGIEARGGRVAAVETTRGRIECETLVNAAGPWSREVAALAGIELPNRPVRHEILVTESLKPFLDPMLVDMRNGLYVNQDMRGELVAGLGDPHEPDGINFRSSLAFTKRIARGLLALLPGLGDARVLRQWAGMYDVTPDNKPVLGPTPALENFVQLNGASGHGFMISPATDGIVADLLLGRRPRFDVAPYALARFAPGRPLEPDPFVIG
ncbi:MAG: NAD(P)/FAD-dependent oxidoreductase [Thermoplasmatota archaeon]